MTIQQEQLAVTVIGGYLGSGKTTLVNHLLRNANGLRLAVLVNEFGELAIDEDLIEAEDDDIISIAGGCVCCSFGSDLTAALADMAKMSPRPDHILIESSGVAIPSAIVASVSLLAEFRTDGIVVVADAETVKRSARDKYMGDTVIRQIDNADIIVLNKIDLVSAENLDQTRSWLQGQNDTVRIVNTTQGVVPLETVLDSFLARVHEPGPHHEAANLDMLTIHPSPPADAPKLAQSLAEGGFGIIRAKGFATDKDGKKILIQVVGSRWETTPAPDHMKDGIVCLGFKEAMQHAPLLALAETS